MKKGSEVKIGNVPRGLIPGDPVSVPNPVPIKDNLGLPVEHYIYQELNPFTILNTVPKFGNTLTLAPGHEFINPDRANFTEDYLVIFYDDGTSIPRFFQSRVVDVVGDVIRTGIRLPFAISDLQGIKKAVRVNTNMNVLGTLDNPVIFSTTPPDGLIWYINRVMPTLITGANPTDALFGGGPRLDNGIFFGVESDTTSEFQVNIIDNGEFADSAFDLTYAERQTPATDWGIRVRKTINGQEKAGLTLELLSSTHDKFLVYIQDDLTEATRSIKRFRLKVNGRVFRP